MSLIVNIRLAYGLAVLALVTQTVTGCSGAEEPGEEAAVVEHAVPEAMLTTLTLSADAVNRLRIAVEPIDSSTVAPTRTVGGEVVVPPGESIVVAAPVAGTVLPPEGGALPFAGARVRSAQPLLRLVALPADRDMSRVQQELRVAQAQLEQARAEYERLEPLYADRLIPARQFESARANLVAAEAAHEVAVSQSRLVQGAATGELGGLSALLITAPAAGVIRSLSAASGQTVAAGTPLAEILGTERLWIRVPVYGGDAGRFDLSADVVVRGLGGSGTALRGVPVAAPPSADATAASVNLYYEIGGDGAGALRPGERVEVILPMNAPHQAALTVPLASLVRDMSGGSWVYVRVDSQTFTRQRVDVVRIFGDRAVIALGPPPGTEVVTAGAAELFGTEFGAGH